MKKLFVLVLAVLSISFVSCGKKEAGSSVEEKANEYAKEASIYISSMKEGKLNEVHAQFSEWYKTLPEADQAVAKTIFEDAEASAYAKLLGMTVEEYKASLAPEQDADTPEESADSTQAAVDSIA